MTEIKIKLFRFDPSSDSEPRYETYALEGQEPMRVQDVLDHLIEKLSVPLAYRWFCGVKKCGACGICLNGRPVLACWEKAPREMILEPLANFTIIRDLVVNTKDYERYIQSLHPMIRREAIPKYPEKISQDLMSDSYVLMSCIECWICSSAIPINGLSLLGPDWERFAGPAALVLFAKASLDPRDTEERFSIAERTHVEQFPYFPILSNICPNKIEINRDAIEKLKRKYYNENEVMQSKMTLSNITRIFIKGDSWSAFVQLESSVKEKMIKDGTLKKLNFSQIDEAYSLEKSYQ